MGREAEDVYAAKAVKQVGGQPAGAKEKKKQEVEPSFNFEFDAPSTSGFVVVKPDEVKAAEMAKKAAGGAGKIKTALKPTPTKKGIQPPPQHKPPPHHPPAQKTKEPVKAAKGPSNLKAMFAEAKVKANDEMGKKSQRKLSFKME